MNLNKINIVWLILFFCLSADDGGRRSCQRAAATVDNNDTMRLSHMHHCIVSSRTLDEKRPCEWFACSAQPVSTYAHQVVDDAHE